MPEPAIRECQPADFDDILLLLHQLWPGKELHADAVKNVFERGLKSGVDKYFCAEVDRKVVGFCSVLIKNSFWQQGYSGYINELVVDKPFRGRKIGTVLIQKAFQYAKDMGCTRIEMDSAFSREEARQFYEEIGFIKRAYLFSRDL